MKTLILIALALSVISCGKKESSSPYLFEVNNLNKTWNVSQDSTQYSFDSIDLSDLNNVSVVNLERQGNFSNCVYSANQTVYNDFYGSLELTYVSGDSFVCSQLNGVHAYEAINDTKRGYEYLKILKAELR